MDFFYIFGDDLSTTGRVVASDGVVVARGRRNDTGNVMVEVK